MGWLFVDYIMNELNCYLFCYCGFWIFIFLVGVVVLFGCWGFDFNVLYMDESDYFFVGCIFFEGGLWFICEYVFLFDLFFFLLGFGEVWNGFEGVCVMSVFFGLLVLMFFYCFV